MSVLALSAAGFVCGFLSPVLGVVSGPTDRFLQKKLGTPCSNRVQKVARLALHVFLSVAAVAAYSAICTAPQISLSFVAVRFIQGFLTGALIESGDALVQASAQRKRCGNPSECNRSICDRLAWSEDTFYITVIMGVAGAYFLSVPIVTTAGAVGIARHLYSLATHDPSFVGKPSS